MEIHLDSDDKPYALFEIHRDPESYDTNMFINLFPACSITIAYKTILIKGSQPSIQDISYAAGKKVHIPPAYHTTFTRAFKSTPRKQKNVKWTVAADAMGAPPPYQEPTVLYQWRTEAGVYNSNDGRVFPLQAKEKAFVIFALADTLFPTRACYEKLKSKVEEGRMVGGSRGEQGLQYVPGRHRDLTVLHGSFFLSRLRCKVLGEWGDIRAHANRIVNEDNIPLYRFCSVNLASH